MDLASPPVATPAGSVNAATLRVGRIIVDDGVPAVVRRRWLPVTASVMGVYWDIFAGRGNHRRCEIDFHVPWGSPGFVTLDYIRAGRRTGYGNLRRAVRALEQYARDRRSHAIVAHVTNPMITDRLLTRLGWEQHCLHWRGRHWIRRLERVET